MGRRKNSPPKPGDAAQGIRREEGGTTPDLPPASSSWTIDDLFANMAKMRMPMSPDETPETGSRPGKSSGPVSLRGSANEHFIQVAMLEDGLTREEADETLFL